MISFHCISTLPIQVGDLGVVGGEVAEVVLGEEVRVVLHLGGLEGVQGDTCPRLLAGRHHKRCRLVLVILGGDLEAQGVRQRLQSAFSAIIFPPTENKKHSIDPKAFIFTDLL